MGKQKRKSRDVVGTRTPRLKLTPRPEVQTREPTEAELARARTGRTVALVIAGAVLLWLGALWAGPRLGLPGEYALLFDLMALAALFWALVVSVGLWRKRNER